jgi:hypothetical protein
MAHRQGPKVSSMSTTRNGILYINPKNAFIGVGLFFENRQEARKLGLLPPGKSFEAVCDRLGPQERKERVSRDNPTPMIPIALFGLIEWA